jgi:undecaprenyl-diphosphatase
MDVTQAILFAVLQGVTELFPVSSLGHAVVVPHLLHWDIDQAAPAFLPFLVMLHVGTALALLVYFWRDWWRLLQSILRWPGGAAEADARRLLTMLVLGTIPAGILGLLLEKRLAALFAAWQVAAVFLIVNGGVLFLGEALRRRRRSQTLGTLRPWQAVAIGGSQALALIPGLSRSGCSMVGGLLVGLDHQSAARFSFLLATPIILAAAALELPKLATPDLRPELVPALLGGLIAGIAAYLSTTLLMRYFKAQEINALVPFGIYCIVLGGATLVFGR